MLETFIHRLSTIAWDFRYRLRNDHSQFGEQEFLRRHLPNDLSQITYIDIGAHTPVKCSNSFFLYRAGSSGIAVDPISSFAFHWSWWRPRDIFVNRVVVGPNYHGDGFINFFRANRAHELLSTASDERERALSVAGTNFNIETCRVVDVVSLLNIFHNFFSTAPSLVLIDVEGMDQILIEGIDRCIERKFLPNFLFFEQLDKDDDDLQLANYSLIAQFIPLDESHPRSLLYQKKALPPQ